MDIQDKISDERLSFYATTQPPFGYTGSDINRMALELLALRAQLAVLNPKLDYIRRLEREVAQYRAAPPAPFVVKLPRTHFVDCFGRLESDDDGNLVFKDEIIEAIKAAGGEVADE